MNLGYDPKAGELWVESGGTVGGEAVRVDRVMIRYLGDGGVLAVTMTPSGIDLAFAPTEEEPGQATVIPMAPGRWRVLIGPEPEAGGQPNG